MYTIHSSGGVHLTSHPDGGTVAYLFHHRPHAELHIEREGLSLAIQQIDDLKSWLETLQKKGIDHVFESLAAEAEDGAPISNMHNVRFRILFMELGLDSFE